jgi:hypothetical protein
MMLPQISNTHNSALEIPHCTNPSILSAKLFKENTLIFNSNENSRRRCVKIAHN